MENRLYNELIRDRLDSLRVAMRNEGIDYYLFTTSDFHNSEYVADYFKSREYFSGFTGSNGDLLVWEDGAALWTDGRYFLQAADELSGTGISLMKMGIKGVPSVEEFIVKNMLPGQKLGTDGRCIPISRGERLADALKSVNSKACADAENPTESKLIWNCDAGDKVWADRPKLPAGKIRFVSELGNEESRSTRLEQVRENMRKEGAKCLILSSLDDIAWLFGIRGSDIEYNPVALTYAIVSDDNAWLFIRDDSCINETEKHFLEIGGVSIKSYDSICDMLKLIEIKVPGSGKIWIDPDRLSYALYMCVKEGVANNDRMILQQSPTVLMKALKTEREVLNEKRAHINDGIAVTRFLYMLHNIREDERFKSGESSITELEAADALLTLRKMNPGFIDQSFAPIIATGAHGAIIHYEPDDKSNARIEKDAFLLMDTGAHYIFGTTDITRTMVMGEPTEEMKRNYTAVLCGNLELADAYFPEGTTGPNLDILARKALWKLGLDYRHGTGHGVGYLLNVHEGPQNINQKGRLGKLGTPFEAGMITSDEPGVYLDGKYGIRLENMMVCVKKEETEYGTFYGFDTLTMVPFDRRCIDVRYMSEYDIELLNKYHENVYSVLEEYMTDEEREWLRCETAPFEK